MRRLICILVLLLVPLLASGELQYRSVSATATSQTIILNSASLLVINDGANEIYVAVFDAVEAPSAATTSDAEIKVGEGFEFEFPSGQGAISIVCAAAETATVRLFYR